MTYIDIRDALATILSKSASVEDVLVNVAPENRETLMQALAIAENKLEKKYIGSKNPKERPVGEKSVAQNSELMKFGERGQWELKTVVFNSAHPKNPAGKQPEPEDKNPDRRTGVNIDKNEDIREDNGDDCATVIAG